MKNRSCNSPVRTRYHTQECKCKQCGGIFYIYPRREQRGFYCSHACCYADKTRFRYGKDNQNWRGGKFINHEGYVEIRNPDMQGKKYILEHRYLMEQKLGRKLSNGETVHHINGIRDDNRIENLELCIPGISPKFKGIRARDLHPYYDAIRSAQY